MLMRKNWKNIDAEVDRMTYLEDYAIDMLAEFVENAKKDGLCHKGYDINPTMQKLIINIIEDYMEECESGGMR